MKAATFEYHAPRTVDEALSLRSRFADDAAVLAGGQSLIPMLNLRLARPAHVIDLGHVEGLDALTTDGEIRIGASVTQRTVERSGAVASANPLVSDALRLIGHPQTRSRGTVVGSLAHADPAAELPAVVLALDAVIEIAGPRGVRDVRAGDLFTGYFSTVVEADEVIIGVRVPVLANRSRGVIAELSRTRGDFALVGAVSIATVDDTTLRWRVALFGVDSTPLCFDGECASDTDDVADDVASAVSRQITPASDLHATADHRRALARGLIERTLSDAIRDAIAS